MAHIIEDLALILALDEARKKLQPRNYWPTDEPGASISFAGRELSQEDLADLVFTKYKDLFLAEAAKILENRTKYPLMSLS